MNVDERGNNDVKITEKRFGCLQVIGLLLVVAAVTAGMTLCVVKTYLFPSRFTPVTLSPTEEKVLAEKLEKVDAAAPAVMAHENGASDKADTLRQAGPAVPLTPEPYSEEGLVREIGFTERELNGLLAKNTDLADKLAIDLSRDLISARLLLPIDEDFPVFGGKILRVKSGMEFRYNRGRPVVMLKGITVMGIPIPNAWMGGIKNIDLVEKFGTEKGFWKAFSDGVEDVTVEEGLLKIKLKE